MKRRMAIIGSAFLAAATLGAASAPSSAATRAGVVLWNTLDSAQAVTHSMVGPDGAITGGGFVAGRFGSAFVATHDQDFLVQFPATAVNRERGTIEFWGRIRGFSPSIQGGGGYQPAFVVVMDDSSAGYGQVIMTANDGAGGGGLEGMAGHNETASGGFGSWQYSDVLGHEVNGWHHH